LKVVLVYLRLHAKYLSMELPPTPMTSSTEVVQSPTSLSDGPQFPFKRPVKFGTPPRAASPRSSPLGKAHRSRVVWQEIYDFCLDASPLPSKSTSLRLELSGEESPRSLLQFPSDSPTRLLAAREDSFSLESLFVCIPPGCDAVLVPELRRHVRPTALVAWNPPHPSTACRHVLRCITWSVNPPSVTTVFFTVLTRPLHLSRVLSAYDLSS